MVFKTVFCGLQNLINGSHKFKHSFETHKKVRFKTVILEKHGFENLINTTAISNTVLNDGTMIEIEKRAPCFDLLSRDKLRRMRCAAMAQSERARKHAGEKTLINALLQNRVWNPCFKTVILGTQNLINASCIGSQALSMAVSFFYSQHIKIHFHNVFYIIL